MEARQRRSSRLRRNEEDGVDSQSEINSTPPRRSSRNSESRSAKKIKSFEKSDDDSISDMPRRSTRSLSTDSKNSNPKKSKPDEESSVESVTDAISRRTSSRSNKFSSSLKEPNGNSIADLLQGMPMIIRSSKSSNSKTSTNSDRKVSPRNNNQISSPVKNSKKAINTSSKSPKSPAVRHSSRRRRVKTEINVSDEDDTESSSDEDEDSEGSEDEEEIKIQRIIASRSESQKLWKEVCCRMNTSEVENGSRWFQEDRDVSEEKKFEERFLVKWADLSYLHCSWESQDDLIEQVDGAKNYLSVFFRKSQNGFLFGSDERADGEYFDPSFVQIERILEIQNPEIDGNGTGPSKKQKGKASNEEDNWGMIFDKDHPDYENGTGRQFLVKWGNTSYSDCTYEFERDLILNDVEYEGHVQSFIKRSKKPNKHEMRRSYAKQEEQTRRLYKIFGDKVKDGDEKEASIEEYKKKLEEHIFVNGGQLRDYQAEGVSWLLANNINNRSSILADEMGLGKTIQTAIYVNMLATALSIRGPFLIVAPLSTIPHWYREFTGWTELNTIIYHGSAKDREVIREMEFAFESDHPRAIGFNQSFLRKCHDKKSPRWMRTWKVQIVITTPEMLVTDDFLELAAVRWELLVVDEAHRLKNHSSKLANNLRNEQFRFNRTLLLTGTPIQNNMNELWTLMNIIDPKKFDDINKFMERYGDINSKESVDELHGEIRPYILRRLKEDVEKSVPPKEETLIEVELTVLQKQYYRALYEKNVQFLHRNARKALDGPSINNLAMQLRKCCNHPFLLNGVENEVRTNSKKLDSAEAEAEFLVKASGKLVLLDKLLPRLKDGGHRVLIFSQFKIMLDIIEDYLHLRKFKAERIDGSITGKKRQMAIDRFQSKGTMDSSFIMLLSTRAGGVGINLTAADTCIIFDSDWNPQNDLQAQARCHRIGQTKSVKVYRLLSRKTYEMQMFHMSSLKMGLDQAVLQGIENGTSGDGGAMSKEEVEKLLRHGAYDIFSDEKSGASEKESNDFLTQDIDFILERRAKTVVHDNTGSKSSAAGGTFSKASFKANKGVSDDANKNDGEDVDIDDPEFWTKMVGEPIADIADTDLSGKKRSRKKANYSESFLEHNIYDTLGIDESIVSNESSSDDDSDDNSESYEDQEFNFSNGSVLRNELLQKLKEKRIGERQKIERSRWGGKLSTEWVKDDAEIVLRHLQKFGYANRSWGEFMKEIKPCLSKDYEDDEIKRMCWALCLLAFREAVDDDVNDVARRAERAAEKKRELEDSNIGTKEPGNTEILVSASELSLKEKKEKQLSTSFGKLWSSNFLWASKALEEAIHFASGKVPRNPSTLENESRKKKLKDTNYPLLTAFHESIWPALDSRGWKGEISGGHRKSRKKGLSSKQYTFKGQIYSSVAEVLDVAPGFHPELANTIESIISTVISESESGSEIEVPKQSVSINSKNINAQSLTLFLSQYAPMQLMYNSSKSQRLLVPRKILDIFTYLHNAHQLLARAKEMEPMALIPEAARRICITNLINVNPKAALPHPSWKPVHDAILIQAIAKHGWIDRESNCRAITEDKSILWGPPFDEGKITENHVTRDPSMTGSLTESEKDKWQVDIEELKAVATRTSSFLNSESEMIKELKGFNMNLVLMSYGIIPNTSAEDGTGDYKPQWVLENSLLHSEPIGGQAKKGKVSGLPSDHDQLTELPTRKELLRRAKIVLSNTSIVLPLSATTDSSKLKTDKHSPPNNFSVLDQSNRCNIFLAEVLRAVIKLGVKGNKFARKLISLSLKEVEFRIRETKSKSIQEDRCSVEVADLENICKHLTLVAMNLPPSRQAKNVLRAILGIDPVPAKNSGEPMYLVEKIAPRFVVPVANPHQKPSSTSQVGAKESKKVNQKESARADVAINRALAIAQLKSRRAINEDGNDISYLKLTSIEALLLSVICSQGIPVYSDEWTSLLDGESELANPFVISWYAMGSVLEAAAEEWVKIAKDKLKNKKADYQSKKRDTIADGSELQNDIEAKAKALVEAQLLHQNPIRLAKVSVMLLEAVRFRMGSLDGNKKKQKISSKANQGLGPGVLQWNSRHLIKWSEVLGIVSADGRPLSTTSADFIPDQPSIIPSAYLDKNCCRSVFIQVSQQTRLRSLFIKHNENELKVIIPKAVRNLLTSGDTWDGCPRWWGNNGEMNSCDDLELLSGVLRYGYGGFDEMVRQSFTFSQRLEEDYKLYSTGMQAPSVFTRASIQQRLNQITRELCAIDQTTDNMRLIKERKIKCTTIQSSSQNNEVKNNQIMFTSMGGVQRGIGDFFRKTSNKAKVSDKCHNQDDRSIEVIEVVDPDLNDSENDASKRKSESICAVSSPEKKLKLC